MLTLILIAVVLILIVLIVYKNKKLREQEQELSELTRWHKIALTDALTQIPNRAAYSNDILTLKNNPEANLGIILFDIDNFKQINDNYGHLEGDKVLRLCAEMLCEVFVYPGCKVYRIGGDEFAVILQNISERMLIKMLTKVRNREDSDLGFKLSKGYCMSTEEKDFSKMFKNADKMLYADKASKKCLQ